MIHQSIVGNGIDGTSGKYIHNPIEKNIFIHPSPEDHIPSPIHPRSLIHGLRPDRIDQAGWGVVFPRGSDPQIREALAPLLARRRAQVARREAHYHELTFDPGSTWLQFLEDHGAACGCIDPETVPYYLLLVGSPREIPLEVQLQLGIDHAVGRLCFETPEEYAHYARGVLAAERHEVEPRQEATLFGVRNWDDRHTQRSVRHLIRPLAGAVADGNEDVSMRLLLREQTTKTQLQRLLGGDETPALLFTAGHGVAFFAEDEDQREDQGALLCFDWPGPVEWSERLPRRQYLSAQDIPDRADLRGLVTFFFACYSAGTSSRDPVEEAEQEPQTRDDFLSALPQRLLGHPGGGALAVIGHLDRCWPCSFVWPGTVPQVVAFRETLRRLLARQPVGHALEPLRRRAASLACAVAAAVGRRRTGADPDRDAPLDEAFLWLAHCDSRGYVLLGDPAVRLSAPERGQLS